MTDEPAAGELADALDAFGVRGPVTGRWPLGDGHIHTTWLVEVAAAEGHRRVVAQALNGHVFPDLDVCERNLRRIDDHFATLDPPGVQVAPLLRTRGGRVQWTTARGRTWRVSRYAEHTVAPAAAADADQAAEAARAFGAYVAALASLRGGPLEATIRRFHDLPRRVGQLDTAVHADRVGRLEICRAEVDRVAALLARVQPGWDAAAALPVRTVHNDAKVANVLFDARDGRAAVVVDLDTTMPGTVLFDVGELLRTATTPLAEDDDADDGCPPVDPERVDGVVRGFLLGAGPLVTPAERAGFPLAGPLLAFENAVRFLADFLDGDRYFAVDVPDHNRRRARAQLRLTEALLAQAERVATAAR